MTDRGGVPGEADETGARVRPRRAAVDADPAPAPRPAGEQAGPGVPLRRAEGAGARSIETRHEERPGKSRRWPLLVVVPLVLALVGGGWWATNRPSQAEAPVAGTSGSPAAASTPSAPSSEGATTEAPGKGTVAGVKARLLKEGFTCGSEGQPGIDSWLCTHYTRNPAMLAYVGGAKGKRLGRVALNVQDGPGGNNPKALGLQEWLAQQVIPNKAQRQTLLAAVRKGDEQRYAEARRGEVKARGSADGSLVMFVDGWVPDGAQPAWLSPLKPLEAGLTGLGYRCGEPGPQVSCTRSAKGLTHTVDYQLVGDEVGYLKVKTQQQSGRPVASQAAAEVKAVTGLFRQADQLQGWLARHGSSAVGATGFHEGMALDWYPGSSQGAGAVFYLRQSCWTDTVESC
ncbi:hypothetical protein [Luteococcus sp. OSA5]|uniref:hypothetical protein n=1 Tax=Luteococcus sp. OSA5 TaxID=3401630 RepID=UPI003B429679